MHISYLANKEPRYRKALPILRFTLHEVRATKEAEALMNTAGYEEAYENRTDLVP